MSDEFFIREDGDGGYEFSSHLDSLAKRYVRADRLEKAEANQVTPALAEIVEEIHRRAGKEWADQGYDFTVEITADEYARLCKEENEQ